MSAPQYTAGTCATAATEPGIHLTDSDRHDPLLAGMIPASELFGGMLAAPVDAKGNPLPPPDISQHPTRGKCRHCGRVMPRAYIAFCGGWTPLRECDACYTVPRSAARRPTQAQHTEPRERTEPSYA